ncbi:hypothetical protein AB0L71_14340 [Streptomyces sp. NPDC052052]|uniref:hypothetical protein n=1 Tax=Streptomyces sp. NPDC052052 TaxID=3154756 RepID=UPI003416BC66
MKMRGRHSLAVLGAAGVLAAATSFMAAPAATASSSLCNPDCSAAADFKSLGEKLVVHDYASDGYGAVAYIYNNGTYKGRCLNTKGYDASAVTCDFSFAEGSVVSYYVCNWDGSSAFYCSGWRDDTA